jgi:L-rhamnose mutarotase
MNSLPSRPKRFGSAIRVRPECFEEYRRHHAAVWPAVLATITRCNIRNYSIFHRDGVLFGYFEYWGEDYDADMRRMAEDPATQKWWSIMEPMQDPFANRPDGSWWAPMDEVFHHE